VVDFKEANSNEVGCHYSLVVPMTPYQKIWHDRSFQFRKGIPGYMNGAYLIRGPHLVPQGKILTITATRSCMIFLVVSIGEHDGGWPKKLIKQGWFEMDEEVSWHRKLAIYARPIEHDITLPETKTKNTIMAIIYKEPLTRGGNLLCYSGALKDQLLVQEPYKFVDKDPSREACRYRCLQEYESQGYSYVTNGNSHECRCGKRGKRMDELLQETNDKLNYRRPCEADDLSFFGWCTCETVIVHDIQSSCYGASNTGIYTLRNVNVPVFCEMGLSCGNWLLLATITDAKDQYKGSTSPFVADKNEIFPSITKAYSRDWRLLTNIDPQPGDEFMIRRGKTNDHVRFVIEKWCGWGDETNNCDDDSDTEHPFLAIGKVYNEKSNELNGFRYFNGCALGGECGKDGVDGVGFGTSAGILSTKGGAKAFGGAVPGNLYWGTSKADEGDHLPYSYYYRPSEKKGFKDLERLNNLRIERVATRERYEKSYLIFKSKENTPGKLEKLGLRGSVPENLVMRGKDPEEKKEKEKETQTGSGRRRRKRGRRRRERDSSRSRRERADHEVDGVEVAVGSPDDEEVAIGEFYKSDVKELSEDDSESPTEEFNKRDARRQAFETKKKETAVGSPPKSMDAALAGSAAAMAVRSIQEIVHRKKMDLHFAQTRNEMAERDDRRRRRERAERGVYGDEMFREQRKERNTQSDRKMRAERYSRGMRMDRAWRKERDDRQERAFWDEISEFGELNEREERGQRGERGLFGHLLELKGLSEIGERQGRAGQAARMARQRQSDREERADRARRQDYNNLWDFTNRQLREQQEYRNARAIRNQEMREKVPETSILENFGDELSHIAIRQVKPQRRRRRLSKPQRRQQRLLEQILD